MDETYRNRRVLVVGLGRSGVAASELLCSKGSAVVATDLRHREALGPRAERLETLGVELVLGSHPESLVEEADLVVASPGVPFGHPLLAGARRRSIPIWSELELGFREIEGEVVAVTGTKGKSTTATLIADMLRRSGRRVVLAGNIGAPLSAEVVKVLPGTVFVLEVSSFQLEGIESFRPKVAVLLDVSPDHLDWHPLFEDYLRAKARIFENQREDDFAVVFGGNPLTVDMASRGKSRKLYFDLDCLGEMYPHVHREGPWIVRHENGETTALASLEEMKVPGEHNRLNALAASAAAALAGASGEALEQALEHFEGLPHALERVAEVEGVRFYNDSRATNVQAVRAAVESFDGGIFLILGGRFKGGDFRDLRPSIEGRVKGIFAIGETNERVRDALGDTCPVELCESLEAAVRSAHARAERGDVVLLSPAGSSFDMFRDYRDRGEQFREIVHRLEVGAES